MPLKGFILLIASLILPMLLLQSCAEKKEKLSDAQRFETYLQKVHGQHIPSNPQNIFIVPETGCPYCKKQLVGGYFANIGMDHNQTPNRLIIAGGRDLSPELAEHLKRANQVLWDPENKVEKFGLYFNSPILFKTSGRKVTSVTHTNAQNIDSVIVAISQKLVLNHAHAEHQHNH